MQKKILILIQYTLRNEYNELFENINENDIIIPLYIFDEKYTNIMSEMRFEYNKRAVKYFQDDLKNNNLDLIITEGDTIEVVNKLNNENIFDEIRVEKQYASYEIDDNLKIEKLCNQKNVKFIEVETQTISKVSQLPFEVDKIPDTFTKFRVIVEKNNIYNIKNTEQKISYKVKDINLNKKIKTKEIKINSSINLRYDPKRSTGLKHLKEYIWEKQLIKTYKKTRNQMLGEDFSTKFSPYLNLGILSVKEIIFEINKYEKKVIKNESTYWVKFELLWREYCKFISLKYKDKIFIKTGIKNKDIYTKNNKELYQKLLYSQTGYGLIDAGIKELITTGYISNRVRQNIASFFIKNLHLNWIKGAKLFEKYLLDYDPCSNYLNWQYIAGCGNDSREFRYFNIEKQTKEYDPKYTYIKYYVPEFQNSNYPKPIIDFFNTIKISKSKTNSKEL